jgi:hypothetical protein
MTLGDTTRKASMKAKEAAMKTGCNVTRYFVDGVTV